MLDCSNCGQIKDESEFNRDKNKKRGYNSWCKVCTREYNTKRYQEQKDEILAQQKEYYRNNRDKKLEYAKQYREDNRETVLEKKRRAHKEDKYGTIENYKNEHKKERKIYNKEYREENKEYYKDYNSKWAKDNRDHRRQYSREYQFDRYLNDLNYKLSNSLRGRMNNAIKKNAKSGSAVQDLGCSVEELIKYLENQFYPDPKTGEVMTWENWTKDGWHIDHIIPLSSFDLTDRDQFLKACNFNNLRPLWAWQNLEKGDKLNWGPTDY